MHEVEFRIPADCDLATADRLIEQVCAARGLCVAMKSSLASHPGSIHWHYKKPEEKGTLELTLLRRGRRIWAQVHTNRAAAWIEGLLPLVRTGVEQALKDAAGR